MEDFNLKFINNEIIDLYSSFVNSIVFATRYNYIDRNILAEGFIVKLCEIYFERKFKLLEVRYPAFDLSSGEIEDKNSKESYDLQILDSKDHFESDPKIFIQVTSQQDLEKKYKKIDKAVENDEKLQNTINKIGLKNAIKWILYIGADDKLKNKKNRSDIGVITLNQINDVIVEKVKNLKNLKNILDLFKLLNQYKSYYQNLKTGTHLLEIQTEFIKEQIKKIYPNTQEIVFISFVREFYLMGEIILNSVKESIVKCLAEEKLNIIIVDPNIAKLSISEISYNLHLLPLHSKDDTILTQKKYDAVLNLLKSKLVKEMYLGRLLIFNPFHFIDKNVEKIL